MRKFSRVLSMMFVLILVLSSFTSVYADTSQVDASTEKLHALGIVVGRTDGSGAIDFAEGETITRAEFASLAVRMMGLSESSAYVSEVQVFDDVPVGQWYTGAVNLAYAKGLIAGYGNGCFGPNDQITRAEATTIMVNLLGYKDDVDSNIGWPTNYLLKANELSIDENVPGMDKYREPARRLEAFRIMDNSLSVSLMERNGEGILCETEDTLVSKYLSTSYDVADVIDAYGVLDGSLAENEITILDADGEEVTLTVGAEFEVEKPYDLIMSEDVRVVYDEDFAVTFLEYSTPSVEKAVVTEVDNSDKAVTCEVDGDEKVVTLDDEAYLWVDYSRVGLVEDVNIASEIPEGAIIEMVLDGTVATKVMVKDYRAADYFLVEGLDDDLDYVDSKFGSSLYVFNKDAVVYYKDGELIDITDIEENNVVYSFEDASGDELVVEVYDDVSVFRLEIIENSSTPGYLYEDDERVEINTAKVKYSLDYGETLLALFDQDLLGEYVMAAKDVYGEIVTVFGDVDDLADLGFYVITDTLENAIMDDGSVEDAIQLVAVDGTSEVYPLDESIDIDTLTVDSFVVVQLEDGYVSSIEDVNLGSENGDYTYADDSGTPVDMVDDVDEDIVVVGGDYYLIDVDTVVFFENAAGDYVATSWEHVLGASGTADVKLLHEEGEAKIVYLEDAVGLDVADKTAYGVVTGRSYRSAGDDSGVYLEMADGEGYFLAEAISISADEEFGYGAASADIQDIDAGDIVAFNLDYEGKIKILSEVTMSNARLDGSAVDQVVTEFVGDRASVINLDEDVVEYFWFADGTIISDARDIADVKSLGSYDMIPMDAALVLNVDTDGKTVLHAIIVEDVER